MQHQGDSNFTPFDSRRILTTIVCHLLIYNRVPSNRLHRLENCLDASNNHRKYGDQTMPDALISPVRPRRELLWF
jgi:hypothetical protein